MIKLLIVYTFSYIFRQSTSTTLRFGTYKMHAFFQMYYQNLITILPQYSRLKLRPSFFLENVLRHKRADRAITTLPSPQLLMENHAIIDMFP